jgi:hypothetical protein
VIPPFLPELEEEVTGAVVAGLLPVAAVPAGIFYRVAHERIIAAVRTGSLRYAYEVRGSAVVLVPSGIDLDGADRVLAEELATRAPVATSADVALLADLARRRRVLLALADVYDAVAAGCDVNEALAVLEAAA